MPSSPLFVGLIIFSYLERDKEFENIHFVVIFSLQIIKIIT